MASDAAFTNSLYAADLAEKSGNVARAAAIYDAARSRETSDPAKLCTLSRCYCDLAYLTPSTTLQTGLVARALSCARLAETLDPNDPAAHASAAVCYAKSCAFSDLKTQLAYSRLFKQEAEKAIALDPKQDVAWYLLGRWNYGIANVGFFSRAYVRMVYGGLPKASFQSAAAYFQKACKLAPDRIIYHAGLAMAYEAMGRKKLELAELKTCCALKPSDPEDAEARKQAALELKNKETK